VGQAKDFSHFFLLQSLFISEGKFSPNLPPVSLVDPMQPGAPPGIVDCRGDGRASHESETHYMERWLQVRLAELLA